MSFGTARRGTMHAMGATDSVFIPRYRVTAALVVAKGLDGLNRHAYKGDLLGWLNDEQAAHFLHKGFVERIDSAPQDAIAAAAHAPVPNDAPAEPVDTDADEETLNAAAPDSGAVDECIATLARLQVPTTAGAPACRTALRGNDFRYSNAVISAAVKRRKSLSRTAADDEDFAVVVA
jgi:hypothetical protein